MGKYKKRSVSKIIWGIKSAPTTGTKVDNNIFPGTGTSSTGVSFPCTISGVRVIGTVYGDANDAVNVGQHFWAVMIRREGEALPTSVDFTSGNTIFSPEQDIIVWGRGTTFSKIDNAATNSNIVLRQYDVTGSTKRKLMIGDSLRMVCAALTRTQNFDLVIQFFVVI
jgi:hypothetical protein